MNLEKIINSLYYIIVLLQTFYLVNFEKIVEKKV